MLWDGLGLEIDPHSGGEGVLKPLQRSDALFHAVETILMIKEIDNVYARKNISWTKKDHLKGPFENGRW
jgi:hypothetical protein